MTDTVCALLIFSLFLVTIIPSHGCTLRNRPSVQALSQVKVMYTQLIISRSASTGQGAQDLFIRKTSPCASTVKLLGPRAVG